MVRLATVRDAEQLEILNNEFNGHGETSLENIQAALLHNHQEFVVVAEVDGTLVGFVCVQLKKSFCYDDYMVEITEVYVNQAYRKRGMASAMISFAEQHCKENYPFHKIELLTGKTNVTAQALYEKLGYQDDRELHLSKRIAH
jgi:ribosomal protein S18 acetylase RimI-like enzyme